MELDEAIRGRRSIRSFSSQPVPLEMVRGILEAGTWAPSAKNGQQWRFTVLMGQAKKRLTDLFRSELEARASSFSSRIKLHGMGSSLSSCAIMEQAPVLIMVWNAGGKGWESEEHSVAAAIQNMLLKAYGLGLGSLWIADIYYALDALTMHLAQPWKLMAAVAIGWPASAGKAPPKLSVDDVSEFLS
jgi:nitroreductase